MKTFLHLWPYLAEFWLKLEIFKIEVVENEKAHFVISNFSSLWDDMEKYGGAREAADDNVVHARWLLYE